MTIRKRADLLLVERGLFDSRAKAQAAIAAGLVSADDRPVRKPAEELAANAAIVATPAHPYVSRGGVKLAGALAAYPIPIGGRVCLDVGSSTGGFTEVLIESGARRVHAVDVGRDQLHPRLRGHPRIVSHEATDIRGFDSALLPEPPEVVVVDASFISLRHVLPPALALAAPRLYLLALVKPQFEAGRAHNKRGIVRDPAVHAAVCEDLAAFVTSLGCQVDAVLPSPISGGDGNREFFIGAHRD